MMPLAVRGPWDRTACGNTLKYPLPRPRRNGTAGTELTTNSTSCDSVVLQRVEAM